MKTLIITSRTNETVTGLSKLKDKKGREEQMRYLCEGYKLCCDAVGYVKTEVAVVREDKANDKKFIDLCERSGAETMLVLSEGAYGKLTADKASDGVIFVNKIEDNGEISAEDIKDERICALDNVRDPGNVGTILRSAAAMGFDRVVMWGCADIYNPKTVRATMGAMFKIKTTVVESGADFIEAMKKAGRRPIACALSDDGMTLGEDEIYKTDIPVLGNEAHGVSDETINACGKTIIIPMSGKTESLNAAAAAAIILWEYSKIK